MLLRSWIIWNIKKDGQRRSACCSRALLCTAGKESRVEPEGEIAATQLATLFRKYNTQLYYSVLYLRVVGACWVDTWLRVIFKFSCGFFGGFSGPKHSFPSMPPFSPERRLLRPLPRKYEHVLFLHPTSVEQLISALRAPVIQTEANYMASKELPSVGIGHNWPSGYSSLVKCLFFLKNVPIRHYLDRLAISITY